MARRGSKVSNDRNTNEDTKGSVSVTWSDAEDVKWVELLLEEQANGMQAESGWKKATWIRVLGKLQEAMLDVSKDKTWEKLKSHHEQVSVLVP